MKDGNSLPNTAFLRDIQDWVWKRFPTRQLSATDIFYVLQWADSGVPACIFIDGFENWLKSHPREFVSECRLSSLQFEAGRIISAYRQTHAASSIPEPIIVDDPYETALNRIADQGRKTNNPLLRNMLRTFYQQMLSSRKRARKDYPDWNTRSESFYPLQARAIIDWNTHFHALIDECFRMLAEQEQEKLTELTPAEKLHCMQIGSEAQQIYKTHLLQKKIAQYFDISPLLESL